MPVNSTGYSTPSHTLEDNAFSHTRVTQNQIAAKSSRTYNVSRGDVPRLTCYKILRQLHQDTNLDTYRATYILNNARPVCGCAKRESHRPVAVYFNTAKEDGRRKWAACKTAVFDRQRDAGCHRHPCTNLLRGQAPLQP